MTDLTFTPLISISLLISWGLLLTIFFLYLEVKRKTRFLLARVLALLLMMLSVVLFFLKPSYQSTETSSGYVLLTKNYSQDIVDSLLSTHPALQCIHTREAKAYKGSRMLQAYEISELNSSIRFIVGEGLRSSDLELVTNQSISYLPASQPIGITALHIPDRITIHEEQMLRGRFNSNQPTLVRLVGPGGVEDSVLLEGNKISSFSLDFKPPSTGNFLYSLEWTDEGATHREKVPINVMPAHAMNTLLIQAAPSIEMRMLKSYLAEGHYGISVRYQLSKDKFRNEFINSPTLNLAQFNLELLKKFDLLVMETSTLITLSSLERKNIDEAIHQGLGLVILLNSEPDKENILQQFLVCKKSLSEQDTISFVYGNQQTLKVKLGPTHVEEQPFLIPHLQKGSSVYAGHISYGFGKIGFQRLEETYRLRLTGEKDAYAYCWNSLLKNTARNEFTTSEIRLQNDFPYYVNEQIPFTLLSEQIPVVKASAGTIPLQEDIHIDNRWHGSARFATVGWQTFYNTTDSTTHTLYVSAPEEWPSLRSVNQMNQVRSKVKGFQASAKMETEKKRKEISPWLFFSFFLLSAGFLWLAPKL